MVLTDELFEKGKRELSVRDCLPIDENYVLLKKSMPCTDAELDKYIENIRKAHDSGINTPRILDYRFIEGTTSTYNKDDGTISYTVGVFLEERAKGVCISSTSHSLKSNEDYFSFLDSVQNYIDELEKRANASQDMYDKLVSDYIGLSNYNICPDPKPTNFFFDPKQGYSIIDVIDQKQIGFKYIPQYILIVILGYGLPHIFDSSYNDMSFLTQSLFDRYNAAKELVLEKAMIALKKMQIPEEQINEEFNERKRNYEFYGNVIPDDKVEEYINSNRNR